MARRVTHLWLTPQLAVSTKMLKAKHFQTEQLPPLQAAVFISIQLFLAQGRR